MSVSGDNHDRVSGVPGRLLLVKLGSIGDAVGVLPLVNRLRRGLPGWEIAWLIEPKAYPAVAAHSAVDRFIIHRRGEGALSFFRALGEVRKFKPDLVIDLQRILRSSFFTFFSGSRRRLGFDRARCKEMSWLFTNLKIPPAPPGRHMVSQYLEFADYLGLPPAPVEFNLPRSPDALRRARELLGDWAGRPYLVFNIGAGKPANRWPPGHWGDLVARAATAGWETVLTGGPSDRTAAREIRERGGAASRDLTGSGGLEVLIEVLASARAVVSADTGPMHIASALGVPVLALFGPADPARTGPYRHLDLVLRSPLACAGCGLRRCPGADCMAALAPERVWAALEKILRHPAAPGEGRGPSE